MNLLPTCENVYKKFLQLTKKELNEIIASHGKWLRSEKGGKRAYLSGADLSGADLSYAALSGADLSNADLSYAALRCAALSGADLSYADLSNADLSGADLSYADLRGADLSYADLSNADLSNAYLSGADLDDYIVQVVRIGSRKGTTTYNATTDTVLCGCWNNHKGGTLAEFEQRIENVYGNDSKDANEQYYAEYMAAIAFFKNIKRKA